MPQLAEDLEQAGVHRVVERVVLVGVVVGDGGDRPVDVEPNAIFRRPAHESALALATPANQAADGFGVRANVVRSTDTSPKCGP